MPVTRAQLTAVTDVTAGATIPATSMGWYLDVGASGGIAMRMVSDPKSFNGIVSFAPLLTSGDACSPSGTSRIFAVDFATGKSALIGGEAFVQYTTAITDVRFVGVGRTVRLIAGDVQGVLRNVGFTPPAGVSLRLLNWREVPTID